MKDKQSSFSNIIEEAMTARGMSTNHQKGKRDFRKSKIDGREDLKKNQNAFCKEEEYWKIDCPKLKQKKESKSEANIAQMHNGNDSDSSDYSLSITPIGYYLEESEWILDTGATYRIYPKWEWFSSFEKLDTGLVTFGIGYENHLEGGWIGEDANQSAI